MIRLLLRLVALLGPVGLIAWQALTLPPLLPRQANGLFPVLLLWLFVPWLLLFLLWPEFSALLKKPDLLVPFGLYLTASGGVAQLDSLPAVAAALNPALQVPVLGLSLSLGLLLRMLIGLPFAVWTTRLILQHAEGKPVDLLAGLAEPGQWGSRAAAAYLVGGGGLFLFAVLPLALALAAPGLGLTLAAVVIVWWNVASSALLLHALDTNKPLGEALAEGLRLGRRYAWRHWALFVIVQLLLLGCVIFLSVHYTVIKGPNQTTAINRNTWSVNGFWAGGYEDSWRWLSKHADALETRPLPPLVLLASIPLLVFAVAVKMRIADGLKRSEAQGGVDLLQVERYLAQRPVAAWPVVVTFLITALVAAGLITYQDLTRKLLTAQLVRQYRERLDRGEPQDQLHRWLQEQGDAQHNVELLSRDTDPRVRGSLVPLLAAGATPAQKRQRRVGAFSESWSGLNGTWVPTLERLLDDPDESVRRRALEAVTTAREARTFEKPLLRILTSGPPQDRLLVAESLANWNPHLALKILPDRGQPQELRLAILGGAERWGWAAFNDSDLGEVLVKMLDDPDTKLRHAAIRGLRYANPRSAPRFWQQVLEKPNAEDRELAFRVWVDALVDDEIYGGDQYPVLDTTQQEAQQWSKQVIRKGALGWEIDTRKTAFLGALLCEAARGATERLDRERPVGEWEALIARQRGGPAAPAFARQLQRLRLILRVLAHVRQLNANQQVREAEFTFWLPQEKPEGPPAKRKVGPYLLRQAQPALRWCRAHAGGYPSRFLHANGPFGGPDPWKGLRGKPRTVGNILKDIKMDTDDALQAFIHQNDKK